MYRIGIKELRNKLSYYIEHVKKGDHVIVTDRGRAVAVIVPTQETDIVEKLMSLVRERFGFWEGGKPSGSPHPVPLRGRPLSDIVVEGRR